MSAADPILSVRGVGFAFGDRQALAGIDIDVQRGEIFGLLGPNGSGKSTLLSVLTGARPMQSGELALDGAPCRPSDRHYRRAMGVVFQSPALDQKLTARENLGLVATMHGFRGQRGVDVIARSLALANLEDRAESLVGELSGGMTRRLDIARALLPSPRILFMDEPTTGLDEPSYRALWAHLEEANRRDGVTIVVATHRADEAERCGRLCVIDKGAALKIATPRELCATLSDDLVVLTSDDPAGLVAALTHLDLNPSISGDEVHVGCADGHALVPRIFEAVPAGGISAVAVRRPGLADAFVALTGRSLASDDTELAA